jgi:quercetin dioxygenase-like cupin family protein
MKIQDIASHEQAPVTMDGAKDVRMRMLIGPQEKAPSFYMRHFEVQPGGHTPHHAHDYEHEIIVLKGAGVARTADGDRPFKAGEVIYVPANEQHQFRNTSDGPVELICLIPAPEDCTG